METFQTLGIGLRFNFHFFSLMFFILLFGCSTKKVMEDNHAHFNDINEEYSQLVKVNEVKNQKDEIKPTSQAKSKNSEESVKTSSTLEIKKIEKTQQNKSIIVNKNINAKSEKQNINGSEKRPEKIKIVGNKTVVLENEKKLREPRIEDDENFNGRRPLVDPFSVGESVVLGVSYFGVEAGDITLQVKPFKNVNEKKAYHFAVNIKSSTFFSRVYAVNNGAETFVDYDSLVPLTFSIDLKESSRLKEVRMFVDQENDLATYWEKTVKNGEEPEKKKKEWKIEKYSQNVISAVFYLRNFTLYKGKKLAFHVADDGKNLLFNGEVIREEKISTPMGEFDTAVVKISFQLDGQFKQTGDNIIWLTKDKYRYPVKIESKIKIGSLVAKLKTIQKGNLTGH